MENTLCQHHLRPSRKKKNRDKRGSSSTCDTAGLQQQGRELTFRDTVSPEVQFSPNFQDGRQRSNNFTFRLAKRHFPELFASAAGHLPDFIMSTESQNMASFPPTTSASRSHSASLSPSQGKRARNLEEGPEAVNSDVSSLGSCVLAARYALIPAWLCVRSCVWCGSLSFFFFFSKCVPRGALRWSSTLSGRSSPDRVHFASSSRSSFTECCARL